MSKQFNEFLAQLKELSLSDLMALYLESKTGDSSSIDNLPVGALELIEELEEYINNVE